MNVFVRLYLYWKYSQYTKIRKQIDYELAFHAKLYTNEELSQMRRDFATYLNKAYYIAQLIKKE